MSELHVSGLCRSFRNGAAEIHAVRNLDLRVPAGSFTVIVGTSGCGKTTLLRLVAGLEKPDSGVIIFDEPGGAESGGGTSNAKPRFGFMFQDARLLPWLTVQANLRLAFPEKGGPETAAEIDAVLRLVGLENWKDAYPRRLSGGMAQRVALARALCRKPRVLLLDEPFGALDAFTRSRLRRDLDELWRALGITVILVTHDIEEAVYLAGRVIHMKDGYISGETEIPLPRPRQYHSPEFQELCRKIEDEMCIAP
ncbi:MAG: ABC transporter ATP-binding protein [Spirochaetales bacterium]|jgi:ABC-type nitrate/sulfonate/bicarbonate transport system ATPase subunit|nr:ABC transporter ATP-binding protein [Spirochaetales bacterium]